MDIKFRFGQTIRKLRKERGMTQEKLGELSGLHASYIGGMERGERNPSLKSLQKISAALEVSLTDTFAMTEEPELARESAVPYFTDISSEDAEFLQDLIQRLLAWKEDKG